MASAAKSHALEVEGRNVAVSNLDKPMFPSGFNKGQVIDYYIRVSDYLLPHLAGRPVTLNRFPDGVRGNHFYEKDAPKFTPKWVRTVPVPRRNGGRDIHYVVLDDLASLVWSANLANLELHPFLHRAPQIEQPTQLMFDLDPGPGADVLTCAEVAFLLKAKLESAGLQLLAKVSGSKGIQVVAPLNTAVTYEASRAFAKSVAEDLARAHPDLVVSEMAKNLRPGKVLVDWSQNADFKTTVSVYSLRAKRDEPYVSMPVEWKELKTKSAARLQFEPEAALKRLKKTGDLFAPVLSLKQHIR